MSLVEGGPGLNFVPNVYDMCPISQHDGMSASDRRGVVAQLIPRPIGEILDNHC
jgi:hypothetical protein